MSRRRLSLSIAVCALLGALVVPVGAGAASPASFTTNATGSAVNQNHYAAKCDVYLNGGPTGAALPTGSYTFFVLQPGGQATPNGPDLLSSDANSNRTFSSTNGTISYTGTHPVGTDAVTGNKLIGLCDYNTTSNPGGVYILAICPTDNQTPSGCRYDAFKVAGAPTVDLTATKTAVGAFTRTYSWGLTKSVDKTYVQASGGTATFNYTVSVTKSTGADSGFTVTGKIQVFNPNTASVTGVTVSDAIGDTTCAVTGGSSTIAGGGSATFDYSCSLADATAATTGTNVATISWNQPSINSPNSSTTASAPFDFSADPTLVGDCTTVTDRFDGTPQTLGSPCASTTFQYPHTVPIPQTGCRSYTNTAVESTSGSSDSETVKACGTNSNGFTIGYWSNKNGQGKIKNAAEGGLCAYLAGYSAVLSGAPPFPSPCNATTLPKYVADVIAAANASGTGVAMFKAQFLATALSAYFSSALANTGVVVPASIDADGCMTVSELLVYGNASFGTLSADRAALLALKDIYDNINNNNQVTC